MVQTGTGKYLEVSYEMARKIVVAKKRVETFVHRSTSDMNDASRIKTRIILYGG
jgi:hypothetical protein